MRNKILNAPLESRDATSGGRGEGGGHLFRKLKKCPDFEKSTLV